MENLIYPNTALFEFLNTVEHSFGKHCNDFNVFQNVIDDITENQFNFKFSCPSRSVEVASEVIVYFLQMRMRQNSYQETIKLKKISREKKKFQNCIILNILYKLFHICLYNKFHLFASYCFMLILTAYLYIYIP